MARRYVVGETPTCRVKVLVNEPTLVKPTARQISATLSSVVLSRYRARSSRRLSRYWYGVSGAEKVAFEQRGLHGRMMPR